MGIMSSAPLMGVTRIQKVSRLLPLQMMTPAPDTNSTGWNVTPLITFVATLPKLKTKLDELGGWNADIASLSGVPSKLLRIAKTVETY